MSVAQAGFPSSLNYPPLVAALGASLLLFLPFVSKFLGPSSSLYLLKLANIAAFVTNIIAVSIPGRIDGKPQLQRASDKESASSPLLGKVSNKQKKSSKNDSDDDEDEDTTFVDTYSNSNGRTLVSPAPWAFAIWAVIYIGEFVFCTLGLFSAEKAQLASALSATTAPFVVANLMQSLWCASFRPSYNQGWQKYVSAFMLAGTAYALSQVSDAVRVLTANASIGPTLAIYYIPMVIHFGWTTAATLVNINGSLAMTETVPDSKIIEVGYTSAVVGAALGVSVTIVNVSPVYGLTLTWALAACGSGMKERADDTPFMKIARNRQRTLCYMASVLCVAAAAFAVLTK